MKWVRQLQKRYEQFFVTDDLACVRLDATELRTAIQVVLLGR